MFKNQKVSVGIIAYNEGEGIYNLVKDFKKEKAVDEVIVIDNNSKDKTAELARKAGAKVVKEERQGYGFACRRALKECRGEIVVLTEGDSSFLAKDVNKMLPYIEDADMVLGTRTNRALLGKNAKMGFLLYFGNLFLAKVIQVKFYKHPLKLTDVGCTYRMIRKKSLYKFIDKLRVGRSEFSPEMIIMAIKHGLRIVEVPINYVERKGESTITPNKMKSMKVGLRMVRVIFKT